MIRVKCSKCGWESEEGKDVDLVRKWKISGDGWAPCPNIHCDGEMEILDN